MQDKAHWEKIYSSKKPDEVSWFQAHAKTSLKIIENAQVAATANMIDVGGGASTLVDDMLDQGFKNITVLDLSGTALQAAQNRLGDMAKQVNWYEANLLEANLPARQYDVWHDRAVFHFLTNQTDRDQYIDQVMKAIKPRGLVIIATFAEDGPQKCSDLPVIRYNREQLQCQFGASFQLLSSEQESHHTPWGAVQQFTYCVFRKTT